MPETSDCCVWFVKFIIQCPNGRRLPLSNQPSIEPCWDTPSKGSHVPRQWVGVGGIERSVCRGANYRIFHELFGIMMVWKNKIMQITPNYPSRSRPSAVLFMGISLAQNTLICFIHPSSPFLARDNSSNWCNKISFYGRLQLFLPRRPPSPIQPSALDRRSETNRKGKNDPKCPHSILTWV